MVSRTVQEPPTQQASQPGRAVTLKFRPAGAPAGAWHHTPWWHCVFHDPYERINFWSHALPGFMLLLLGLAARKGDIAGGSALEYFCYCTATTHLLSALTHVWPDDHLLEKLDHLGIVLLITGTPVTQMMALEPEGDISGMLTSCMGLVVAAFLNPVPRTLGFVGIGAYILLQHWHIVDVALLAQCVLYVAGAACFVRNGGHERLMGLQDHHLLHYKVTVACSVHVANIIWRAASPPNRQQLHAQSSGQSAVA